MQRVKVVSAMLLLLVTVSLVFGCWVLPPFVLVVYKLHSALAYSQFRVPIRR